MRLPSMVESRLPQVVLDNLHDVKIFTKFMLVGTSGAIVDLGILNFLHLFVWNQSWDVMLYQGGGIGRITRGLMAALAALDHANDYVLLASRDAPPARLPGTNFTLRRLPLPERALNVLWHRQPLPPRVEWLSGAASDVF